MKLTNASGAVVVAQGHIGEKAEPDCPDGYKAAGVATCEDKDGKGIWRGSDGCEYQPPVVPATPFCDSPDEEKYKASGTSCARCIAEKADEAKTCECQLSCHTGYKNMHGTTGTRQCDYKKYDCPADVQWDGSTCRDKDGNELEGTRKWCCDEPWKGDKKENAVPPETLKEDKLC